MSLYILLLLLTGCASYKVSTEEIARERPPGYHKELAVDHWLYTVIPRHKRQIRWYDLPRWTTWALFGNDDDGIFAEEASSVYESRRKPGIMKAIAWQLRNPLHNMFFYVIGSADRTNSEFALLKYGENGFEALAYLPDEGDVFPAEHSSFLIGFHGWKPFVSLRLDYGRRLDAYIGWRERGNFGMKLNPAKKIPEKELPR